MSAVQTLILKQGSTRDEIYNIISQTEPKKIKLSIKAKEKLIDIIYNDTGDITGILRKLISVNQLIQSFAEINQKLSVICDKMMKYSISGTGSDPPDIIERKSKQLSIVDEMMQVSSRLKIQLGNCVHEYILSAFSKETLNSLIAFKALKLIVTTISRSTENKNVFSRTNAQQLNGILDFVTCTRDPISQAFAAEVLWRIMASMKDKKQPSELQNLFGSFYNRLESIDPSKFCESIHSMLRALNSEFHNIFSLNVHNLIVGGQSVTHHHAIDFGDSKIIIWISKGAIWSSKQENCDLINLKKEDILGIGKCENHWVIALGEHFDTLPDCFNHSDKYIFFDVDGNEQQEEVDDTFSIVQEHFGYYDGSYIEYPEELLDPKGKLLKGLRKKRDERVIHEEKEEEEKVCAKTPQPKKLIFNIPQKASETPKTTSRVLSSSKNRSDPPQTPSVARLKTKTLEKPHKIPSKADYLFSSESDDDDPLLSYILDSDDSSIREAPKKKENEKPQRKFTAEHRKEIEEIEEEEKRKTKAQPMRKKPDESGKAIKNPTKEIKTKAEKQKPKTENPKLTKNKPEQKKETAKPESKKTKKNDKKVDVSESSEDEILSVDDQNSEMSDDIPLPSFSQSLSFDTDDSCSEYDDNETKTKIDIPRKEDKLEENKLSKKKSEKDKKDASQPEREPKEVTNPDFSLNVVAPQMMKTRTYAPERWELDAFEELKSFANVVRSKLLERQDDITSVIEDATTNAINEVNSFMLKCDQDLEKIRTNFKETSASISSDIAVKQKMVNELGEQQREHIDQMQKDCAILQKRADEMVRRFEQQKKQLIQNQQKHIALFREDLKTEVKTAVTKRKREYSRKKVQKLVNLLEEL